MTARMNRIIRSTAIVAALISGAPSLAEAAPPAAATEAEITEAAPARARRAARPRRVARARRVCTGRGRARRCQVVGAPAPAPGPAPAAAPAPAPSSQAAPAGGGDANAFGFLFANGASPGRWNPCVAVHYSINPNRAPAGGVEDLQEALRRVSGATGLNFVYDGPTTEVPRNGDQGYSGAGTVIAWASPEETNMLTGGVAGMGGAAATSSNGVIKIVKGFVVIDANRRLPAGFGGGQTQGALLMHELGHMVGLDHTGDPAQIMYPSVTSQTPADWGAGDRNGLHRVGATNGCL